MGTSNCLVFPVLQNSIYVQQKKETHSGLKLLCVNNGIQIKHYDRIDRQMIEFVFLGELFLYVSKTTKRKEKNPSLLLTEKLEYSCFKNQSI